MWPARISINGTPLVPGRIRIESGDTLMDWHGEAREPVLPRSYCWGRQTVQILCISESAIYLGRALLTDVQHGVGEQPVVRFAGSGPLHRICLAEVTALLFKAMEMA